MFWWKVGNLVSLTIVLSDSLSSSTPCSRRHGLCTAPWKKWGGSCYLSTQKPLTYDDARGACRRLGAKMAAPRSDQENDFLASLAQGSDIWVACTDRRQEGEWECEGSQDGQGIYTNWKMGEPNNAGSEGSEDCIKIRRVDKKWNDIACERMFLAVCKRQFVGSCFTTNNEGRLEVDSCL
ncbi:CD209 antigen-like protein E [Patiria miniata]|uniref:C-type lectin domain-containing protein n=1 Tax=Patiria miniata TaxID=46514 RepID=A0A914BCR4_PATMI|nr:CD209 antigen-like protein E [Patiria miniata]